MPEPVHPPLAALLAVALEQAEAPQVHTVQAHLRGCGLCRQRARELGCDLAELMLAVEPRPLPALLREGILQAAGEIHRLFDAALPMARTLRISRRHAHSILLRLDAPRYWQHTPSGWQLRVPESPLRHAHVVRLQAGDVLHIGQRKAAPAPTLRLLMVMQGRAKDEAGRLFGPFSPEPAMPRPPRLRPKGALTVQPGADFIAALACAPRATTRRVLGAAANESAHKASERWH